MASEMELVLISRKELDELLELKKTLPELLQREREEALKKTEKVRLTTLHKKDKEDPTQHRLRAKRLYEKKKDVLAERRREKKLQCAAEQANDELITGFLPKDKAKDVLEL